MKKTLLFIFLIASVSAAFSQEFLGLRQSNYAGIMGADLNPASIADSRFKVDVLIVGGYFGLYNNHMAFNTRKMPHWWIKSLKGETPQADAWLNDGDLDKLVSVDSTEAFKARGIGQLFELDNNNDKRSVFLNTEFDVVNFMVTLDRKRAIGFQIRHRTFFNLDNVSPELIRLATNEFDYPNLFGISIDDGDFNLTINSWIEYNLSYAQVLSDKNEHFLKAGGKLKFLQGVGSAYLNSSDLNFNIQNDSTANSISANFDYGYSENLAGFIENENSADEFSAGNINDFASKLGLGIDFGIIYEWRPNWKDYKYAMDGKTDLWRRDQNKYKLKVGLALNDIGGMRYKKGGASKNFSLNANVFDLQRFDGANGLKTLDSTLTNLSDSGIVTFDNKDDQEYYMNLPSHLNLDVDYNIYKNFYANVYTRINMKFGKDKNSVHYPTSYAITPRFDHKRWGVSLPLSYNNISGFRTGLALRMFNYVSIGTGDLKPLIAPGKDMDVRGLDIFFALRVPILYRAPKDRDKDKVSDKLDQCIDMPGTWALRGCSDSDNDGVLDQNDSCVTDSGLVRFNGCPDTDSDNIMNKEDDCPNTPGLLKFKGCPDTDADGIMDKEDDCPEIPGLPTFEGCPDTDGDGLIDKKDKCPTYPGPIKNKGCPYKSLHSIDEMGKIIETDTLLNNQTFFCFETLRASEDQLFLLVEDDGSSFMKIIIGNDTVTAIRNEKGYFYYQYIPPIEPIEIELIKEEEEILKEAFDNLEFESGKAIIKESSFQYLVNLATLLMKKPLWKIKIAGHTDSQGKALNNLKLSKKRAQAVADFLIKNSILEERIDLEWFGETKPITTNKTRAGRAKNRRVEMKIL